MVVRDFHLKAFFVAGLRAEIRKEVIREGETSIDEILDLAKRYEQAKLSERRGGGQSIPASVLASAVEARLAELGFQATTSAVDTKKKGNSAPKRDRPMENVVCYYDGSPGHLASKCQKRINDRARGVWRPTVRDPETNSTQWDQMSKEQWNRGAKI